MSLIYNSDCIPVMQQMEPNSIDTIITDPPYALGFMGKDWDKVLPGIPYWQEALRVAKPGAFLLAFGGTRTHHRLMVAIEDAGWEIRDTIMWLYGSGFPKSLNISKAIDLDACREDLIQRLGRKPTKAEFKEAWENWRQKIGTRKHPILKDTSLIEEQASATHGSNEWAREWNITIPTTPEAQLWNGWSTALKPAWEPIIVAMKPLDGTFANNALKWGVGGLNIDGGRIGTESHIVHGKEPGKFQPTGGKTLKDYRQVQGRFPANLILDEEAAAMLNEQSGESKSRRTQRGRVEIFKKEKSWIGKSTERGHNDSGGASRFFYVAKASRSERGKNNNHPTVKPLKLMEYLARLTMTPTGGVVLDLFMGSGTTCLACRNVGRKCIGIERDKVACEMATDRLINQ